MALNKLNVSVTVSQLMQEAIEMNFTKNGEIFDSKFTYVFSLSLKEQLRIKKNKFLSFVFLVFK